MKKKGLKPGKRKRRRKGVAPDLQNLFVGGALALLARELQKALRTDDEPKEKPEIVDFEIVED